MSCNNISGKRLLVLGATKASYDVVINAQKMGVTVIVTDDDPTHPVRQIADEHI